MLIFATIKLPFQAKAFGFIKKRGETRLNDPLTTG
jgi:hypothetical protein